MGDRSAQIVDTLVDAFSDLMAADPTAFRTKFRKMAADPFAFYRGSACLFYADVADRDDPWADERTSRVWIQGDLHAENFGTYMDGDGVLIFDVNDFDEAYLGHFTWDVQRFAASMALLGWRKALSDDDITALVRTYTRAYLDQVRFFTETPDDRSFALRLDTTEGPVNQVLQLAKLRTRVALLDADHRDRRVRPQASRRPRSPSPRRRRARPCGSGLRAVHRVDPGGQALPGRHLRDQGRRRAQRVRHRQRGAARVLRAHRGLQPGAGQRRGALDEARQRRGPVPHRDRPRRSPPTSTTTATAPRSRSERCRPTPTGCSATPTWMASASS